MENSLFNLILLALLIVSIVYTIRMQHKVVDRAKQSMKVTRDALEKQKKAMALAEERLALIRKQTENQDKMISLLEQIKDSKTS